MSNEDNDKNKGFKIKQIKSFKKNAKDNYIFKIIEKYYSNNDIYNNNKNSSKNNIKQEQKINNQAHKQNYKMINNKNVYSNDMVKIKSFNELKNSLYLNQYTKRIINSKQRQIKGLNKRDKKYISVIGRKLSNSKNDKVNSINNEDNSQNFAKNNLIRNNKMTSYNHNNVIKNYNFSDEVPEGGTMAFIKKFNSNSINSQNLTEEQNNKLRIGLLSAYSNSSNNIIIPILPIQRPLSNFNLGVGQLFENIDNRNINKKTMNNLKYEQKNQKINISQRNIKNNLMDKNRKNCELRNKIRTAPGMKRAVNRSNYEEKDKKMWNMNSNNFLLSNYGLKFHHIKIDKSLLNNKLTDSLRKNIILNYINLDRNKLPRIQNNNNIKKYGSMRNYSSKK